MTTVELLQPFQPLLLPPPPQPPPLCRRALLVPRGSTSLYGGVGHHLVGCLGPIEG